MAEEVYESDLINMVIGTHMSIAKGIVKTAENVVKMNADTMQIFSRNPRGSNYKDPTVKEAEEFQRIRREAGFGARRYGKIMHSVRFSHMHRIR